MTRPTVRKTLFYLMVAVGATVLFTGFVLYLWPRGPQSGRLLFLGADKATWSDWHTYLSLFGVGIILFHLVENRAVLRTYVRSTLKGS